MTADVVNLRRARKAKARTTAAQAASVNRAKFGRGGGERAAQDMKADIAARLLDGHRLTVVATTPEGDGR